MEEEVTAIDWLENLPLQTLTDELKQDIIEQFEADRIRSVKEYVTEALKAAAENAELNRDAGQDLNGINIDKDSIINSYPLDQIK